MTDDQYVVRDFNTQADDDLGNENEDDTFDDALIDAFVDLLVLFVDLVLKRAQEAFAVLDKLRYIVTFINDALDDA